MNIPNPCTVMGTVMAMVTAMVEMVMVIMKRMKNHNKDQIIPSAHHQISTLNFLFSLPS